MNCQNSKTRILPVIDILTNTSQISYTKVISGLSSPATYPLLLNNLHLLPNILKIYVIIKDSKLSSFLSFNIFNLLSKWQHKNTRTTRLLILKNNTNFKKSLGKLPTKNLVSVKTTLHKNFYNTVLNAFKKTFKTQTGGLFTKNNSRKLYHFTQNQWQPINKSVYKALILKKKVRIKPKLRLSRVLSFILPLLKKNKTTPKFLGTKFKSFVKSLTAQLKWNKLTNTIRTHHDWTLDTSPLKVYSYLNLPLTTRASKTLPIYYTKNYFTYNLYKIYKNKRIKKRLPVTLPKTNINVKTASSYINTTSCIKDIKFSKRKLVRASLTKKLFLKTTTLNPKIKKPSSNTHLFLKTTPKTAFLTKDLKARTIRIYSHYKTPLTLPYYGFLYTYNFINKTPYKPQVVTNWLKGKYSFINIRKATVIKLNKLRASRATTQTLFLNKKDPVSPLSLKTYNNVLGSNINNSLPLNQLSSLYHYKRVLNWDNLKSIFTEGYSDQLEIPINRIRFKPGYARLWRRYRKELKTTLNLNYKYQSRLTKYLLRYYRRYKPINNLMVETEVRHILLNTHLVPDLQTSNLMFANKMVYINGQLFINPNTLTLIGDIVQLIVHLHFYITQKWLLNWTYLKKLRWSKLIYTSSHKRSQTKKFKKHKNLPIWVLNTYSFKTDIPKYLEVDYLTLSCFVLYEPFYLHEYIFLEKEQTPYAVFNMYNWKYIT